MLEQLEAKYTLFENVEEMLATETLTGLLHRPISDVRRFSLADRGGASDNVFEWVTMLSGRKEQRYALKRIRLENDWLMIVSNDVLCRSVTLWQYGILDKLSSHLDHTIIACSRDDHGWAILMKDVSAGMHPASREIATPHQISRFLDALAFMHATFWQDDSLLGSHLGLNDNVGLVEMTLVPTAQKFAHLPSILATWLFEGWECMQMLLEPDVLEIYRSLMLKPQPLYDAIANYPKTLVHGDYRAGDSANLSFMAAQSVPVCAFDWQFAGYAMMTIDLTWFINRPSVSSVIAPHKAAAYYRERLEHHLGFALDFAQWEAMLELGLLADALRMGCFEAYFAAHASDEDTRKRCQAVITTYNNQIRAGSAWL